MTGPEQMATTGAVICDPVVESGALSFDPRHCWAKSLGGALFYPGALLMEHS